MDLPQPARDRHPGQPGQSPAARSSWPPAGQHAHRELAIWGAHGGTGTTTLAAWLQPARDLGAMRTGPGPACPAAVAARPALVITSTARSAVLATIAVAA